MYERAHEAYEATKTNLKNHIRQLFPITGKKHRLELLDLEIKDDLDPGDYADQKKARMEGRTWSVPVVARFVLKDARGRVVDRARMKIINLPRLTNRGSYVVSGSEYMFPTQKRLRSGPYVRIGQNEELKTFFNMAKGRNFHLGLHPTKGHFQLQIGTSGNIPLYPVLRALGVSDAQMVGAWGREAFVQNLIEDRATATKALKQTWDKMSYGAEEPPDLAAGVAELFGRTSVDPENAGLTVGVKDDHASGRMILAASAKMLRVGRGEEKEDNRESLIHNDMVDISDYVVERFNDRQFRGRIQRQIKFNLDRRDKIAQIVSRDSFQRPVQSLFTESQLGQTPTQSNPLGMINDFTAVTVRGEGGIQQDNALTKSLRALDPSHLGFLDSAHTPEGQGVGTSLHLAIGTKKRGKTLTTRVLDVRTGRDVELTPVKLWNSVVAFSNALDAKGRKLIGKRVKATHKGEIKTVDRSEVDYAFIMPEHMTDINTASMPFVSHNNGSRVMLGSKLNIQAKPLADPDAPMTQVGISGSKKTLERAVGTAFSPRSPIDGVVEKIGDDYITISGRKVGLPNYFPLNNNNFVHARPVVKVGQKVRQGQVLADTNYTKGGDLALGKNLRVAYVPYKGLNVEDGVVMSRKGAAKMTSEHLYQQPYAFDTDTVLDLKRYRSYFPTKVTEEQAKKLDERGVVKKGQVLAPGDLMVASMRRHDPGTESQRMAAVSKILAREFRDDSQVWDKDVEGVVQDVAWRPNEVVVHVRTKEPMRVGDKLVGRYGNKGVVAHIIDDKDMPKDERGRTLDLLLNPNGVISRMNLGQILETTAGRVVEKTGKPFVARGFYDKSADRIASELKKNGLKDHETIYDPVENKKIPGILVGRQYIYKLEHQATKKTSARGGGVDEEYTSEEQPSRGKRGGRAIGPMELYGLLAHGSLANVGEMYGQKSAFDPEVWRAVEEGAPLPPLKPAHSQKKLKSLLRGMGVDIEERGNEAALVPFLDRQVKEISKGEITDHKLLRGRDLKEEKNGLFDTKKTGGVRGENWTHIKLPEPLPNPTFEKAILSLLHMKKAEFDAIMSGDKEVEGKTGGPAIATLLDKIDVKKRLIEATRRAKTVKGAELNALHREIRYLRTLKERGIKPSEYVITRLPVLPPQFRPIYTLPNGSLNTSDINFHYQATLQVADALKKAKGPEFKDQRKKLVGELYKSVGGVMGLNDGIVERAKKPAGIAKILSGAGSPKGGYIHSRIFKRRQDISSTNVLVANPRLNIDEVGLPEYSAWKMMRPFVVRELRSMGMTPLQARKAIDEKTPMARKALEKVTEQRHVIVNRAPSLHKFSIMALKPKVVSGHAMEMSPLIFGGMNADVDGDTLGVHTPMSEEANAEAAKMLPSRHLYKPGTGALQPKLDQEYVLGLFKISRPSRQTARRYASTGPVLNDLRARKIEPDAGISVTGLGSTTPGRVLINEALPTKLRDYQAVWTKKAITDKLKEVDKVAGRKAFTRVLHEWSTIGRRYAYLTGSSFLLSDLQAMSRQRDQAFRQADRRADMIRRGGGDEKEKRKKIVELYTNVSLGLQSRMSMGVNAAKRSNNVMDMMVSGARGNPSQVRQMVSNVGVMMDHENKPMPEPVRGSYAEGLDEAEFFQHMYGNRKGMIDKSQSVKGPGHLTKQVIVSAAGMRITSPDCQTTNGIDESTAGVSALDRHLAENVKNVGRRGELVTTTILSRARAQGLKTIRVRSPLTCQAAIGVCARCYGLDEEGKLPPVGTHVGIKDAQALTEPSTQLAMKAFHSGGAVTGKKDLTSGFDRVKQLFTMPEAVHDSATLAEVDGRVDEIRPLPQGGSQVMIAGQKHKVARGRVVSVKVGDQVDRGQRISDGQVKPQDVLRLNGLRALQTQLRDDIHDVYAQGGTHISPKTIETPVRMMTESVRVVDPGAHPSLVPGDYSTHGIVDAWNRANPGDRAIVYTHQLPGSEYLPHRGDDWAKRLAHNRIQQVLTEAPGMGAKTKIQGQSPFAALALGHRIEQDPWGTKGLTNG